MRHQAIGWKAVQSCTGWDDPVDSRLEAKPRSLDEAGDKVNQVDVEVFNYN